MIFYIVISLYLVVIATLELMYSMEEKYNKCLFILSSIVLLILSSIRWKTGTDWDAYYYYFYNIDSGFKAYGKEDFELGIRAVNVIVRKIGGDFTTLQWVWGIIVFVAQYVWINGINYLVTQNRNGIIGDGRKLNIRNTLYMCLWFLYFANIFTTRSNIAYAILLCALPFALKKRPIPFFAIGIITTVFIHRSCILFLGVYFLITINLRVFHYFYKYVWIVTLFIISIASTIIQLAIRILPIEYSYRITYYLENHLEASVTGLINYIFLYIVFLYFYKKKFSDNDLYLKLFNVFCVGFIPYLFGYIYSAYFIRASWPFMLMAVILIPMDLRSLKRNNRAIIYVVTILYLSLRLMSNLASYYHLYVPYSTILSK